MLFHMSIAAIDPHHVAEVLAELIGGEALPFPPVSENGWVALSDDAHGTSVEVYPAGTLLREAEGDADAYGEPGGVDRFTATHGAFGTTLETEEVLAIARREGWPAKYRKRGGMFGVVELWIEGRQMMEILTPSMQADYLATMTRANWGARLGAGAPL
ncbi:MULTISPECIES: hypothetical protein [unclassified Sphingomonas]|uniref:hypothetical protein n=1 Tax=unclassified Sphingomonas TaxID=196159 RepID=UPI0006F7EADC|nr:MULTISPECIES: hypothetical protein [unclassified Sphingomonas]KQX17672.1 hypothetical protein ASD17_18265 [Sphingomonas sp. Root1294]KQY70598.1 hypothetical protein ASD39_22165 [Sphingomonas sp. Root50]KRB91911.1 hypothetical protein ASE22_08145 [Sphingomonas sp. Root720]